jgi:hypothetical protein
MWSCELYVGTGGFVQYFWTLISHLHKPKRMKERGKMKNVNSSFGYLLIVVLGIVLLLEVVDS